MKISIIRGAFLNPFEMQNYESLQEKFNISVISSKRPISDKIKFPLTKLWSPADLPNFPFKYPILNRLFGDAQKLYGLEKALIGTDIAHVAETYYGYTYQAVMAKRRGVIKKVISTVWETISHNNERLKERKKYKKYSRSNIDHFIAVTERAKKALLAEGIKDKKITVISMGVDLTKFKPNFKYKNKRDLNILCVARLVPEKGVLDLLHAFLSLRKAHPHLRLTFVGSGPLYHDLYGYKNVSVKKISYENMVAQYNKADIFCLPSKTTKTWEEQFGMCLVEAMACGLPIVTTKSGAIPEVCADVALLALPGNTQSLQDNLQKLIVHPKLRHELGQKGRHLAEKKYNRQIIAQQIARVYSKLSHREKSDTPLSEFLPDA